MKIISWNVLYRNGATLDDVCRLIERERPDLLLLQETTDQLDTLTTRVGGHYFRAPPLSNRRYGLATWCPQPLHRAPTILPLQSGIVFDRSCQIVSLEGCVIANVHLSHGQVLNRRQLVRIYRELPHHAAVIGDFNLVGPSYLPGFRDVGPRGGTLNVEGVHLFRLDRCLARGLVCEKTEALHCGPSDHRPIVMWLSPEPVKAAA